MFDTSWSQDDRMALKGRLTALPDCEEVQTQMVRGLHQLGFGYDRDGMMYVPSSYDERKPIPLLLMLHGPGGDSDSLMQLIRKQAANSYMLIAVPESRESTWDLVREGFGADVNYLDGTLKHIFANYNVDKNYLGLAGFSDGASYALSLGLTNGHLFTHLMAYSAGFIAPGGLNGQPKIFLSHGENDRVLPIDVCSRKLKLRLEHLGYDLAYHEFAGGHILPEEVVARSFEWFLNQKTNSPAKPSS